MTSRWAGLGVVLAAVVAGVGFFPVFGVAALVAPVLAALVPVALVDQLTLRRLASVRAPLALFAGSAAGAVALAFPDPPWEAPAVLDGLLRGWRRTLESTLPAWPDTDLLAFVPGLALLAGVLGVEWLRRGIAPPMTLLPSAAVLVLAQLFRAASGPAALATACAYGLAAALVLGAGRPTAGRRPSALAVLALPLVLVAGGGAWALVVADPLGRPPYSVQERFAAAPVPGSAANPLAQLGGRLSRPDTVAFTARSEVSVDRWPLVVLDAFDGAGWSSTARYRPLGTALPAGSVPVADVATADVATADIAPSDGLGGPFLPTQFRTEGVDGIRPAVDPATGVLVRADPGTAPAYRLRWLPPVAPAGGLVGAAIDPAAPTVQVDGVPAGIAEAARRVLQGAPPSFAAALELERWFRADFTLATGDDLPTGAGTAQLLHFLDTSKRGTSEQFAAAYVLMARSAGIPARLVVGFRRPAQPEGDGAFVVRNGDAFAWPEVAVAGVGWVPLDPTGDARREPDATDTVASAAQAARERLPGTDLFPPPQPQPAPTPTAITSRTWSWSPLLLVGAVVAALLLAYAIAVPVAKRVRALLRRRGGPARAAAGAWREARDRLRDHGVPVRPGTTARDLVRPAAALTPAAGTELERLARTVDTALFSGTPPDRALADDAWTAVAALRRSLATRPLPERMRATFRLRSWTEPRP